MYHYLTTANGKQIVDIEPWIANGKYEFSGGVSYIKNFLDFYDTISIELREEFKKDFSAIDEMRGWFFERFLCQELNYVVSKESLDKTHKAVRSRLLEIAEKYGLVYGCG